MAGLQEIDQREAHGLEVTLLRNRETEQLVVLVDDDVEDETFALEVEAREALDAFRHPYAYLAQRRPIYRRRGTSRLRNGRPVAAH